jgi:hypothetical protein
VDDVRTASKGNAAELAVLSAFVERDFDVLLPFGGGHPYDLAVHLSGQSFLRVQCKSARRRAGCLLFNSCTTDHGRGRMPYLGLADIFGVYFASARKVYLVPVRDATKFVMTLRLEPTRNNQRRGVRLASDFEIDRWSREALASLVDSHAAFPDSARRLASAA